MAKYYLTTGKLKLGPLSEKDILSGVRSGKIGLFDMILNNQTGEWMMLIQHPDFSDLEGPSEAENNREQESHFAVGLISDDISEETKASSFVTPENFPILTPVYWYERENSDQRLKYLEVLSLIHTQKLSEQSLISKNPHGPWQKIIDWEEFSPKSLENYKKISDEKLPDVHIRRKSPRFTCGKVFVSLGKGGGFQVFCPDISKTGLAFIVRTAKCDLNESLHLKFHEVLTADNKFDARGIVVSVRKVKLPGAENVYIRYGVRFTHLSESGRKFIEEMAKQTALP